MKFHNDDRVRISSTSDVCRHRCGTCRYEHCGLWDAPCNACRFTLNGAGTHWEPKADTQEYNTDIKNVIFNDPATIVFWDDGTKTVVKCGEWDEYDPEKGLAMAIAKKALGNKGSYFNVFDKWLPKKKTPSNCIAGCANCKYEQLSMNDAPCNACQYTSLGEWTQWEPKLDE